MNERTGATSYPLYWPSGWKRTPHLARAPFRDSNVYRESQVLRAELERLGAKRVVISSNLELRQDGVPYANQRRPDDQGVAVWFWLPRSGVGRGTNNWHPDRWEEHVLACDRWDRAEHNLRAIAKHVEALRGQERWGVGSVSQAFRGYKALPSGGKPWREVLGVAQDSPLSEVRSAYRTLARVRHPDTGGSREAWDELQVAWSQARTELSQVIQ